MDIKILREEAKLPTLGSEYAAGYDLYAAISLEKDPAGDTVAGQIEIPPHETRMIPTGIAIAIPEGYWGGIYARSGLATKQGLRPANCVGVIDADYRGEIFVALHNDTNEFRYVYTGDRIAQLVFSMVGRVDCWNPVEELPSTERGEGGFGSTGLN
jgi:dUTP pyrophosphatase